MAYTKKQFKEALKDIEGSLTENDSFDAIHQSILNYLSSNEDDFLDNFDEDEFADDSQVGYDDDDEVDMMRETY